MAKDNHFLSDPACLEKLAQTLKDTGLTEIEYSIGEYRVRVARNVSVVATPVASQQALETAVAVDVTSDSGWDKHPGVVKSPMVGTTYMAGTPGSDPFVKVGDSVAVGQTLMIIEAMKVMNPIKADRAGVVKHICVQDAAPVEFGEPLLVIA